MKQKNGFEDNDPRFFLDGCKDLDGTGAKRFSLNLPDCSTVMQSQNNNLMDTNQISWLQRFAQDNEKICNSRLLDQTFNNNSKSLVPNNEMKFSFNMNYHHQEKKKVENIDYSQQMWSLNPKNNQRDNASLILRDCSSQNNTIAPPAPNILAEIRDVQSVAKREKRNSHAGSIKKNTKNKGQIQEISDYQKEAIENLPYSKLEDMNDRLSKVLNKDRSGYLQKLDNKQNIKLYSEISTSNLFSLKPIKPNNRLQNYHQEQKIVQSIPSPSFLQQKTLQPKEFNKNVKTPIDNTESLEILFNRLDVSQTGKLSKYNCSIDKIPEDFKFIFGNIFTKIKFKQQVYNKRQFVQLCQDIVAQINQKQVISLLKKLQEGSKKIDVGVTLLVEKPKSPFKISVFQDTSSLEKKKENKLCNACQSNTQSNENKCDQSDHFYKCGTKIDDKSTIFSRQASKDFRNHSQSINKYNQSTKSSLKKESIFQQSSSFYPKKSAYKDSYENSQSQFMEDTLRKRSANISEQMIQDHKKGLQNLKKLNQRMQVCLSTNLLTEHSKSGLLQKDSLSFEQLIRHV